MTWEVPPALPAGIGAVPLNIVDGVRLGSGAAYLLPALGRANLSLLTQTRVVRLRFSGGRAVGVDAIGPGRPDRRYSGSNCVVRRSD